LQGGQQLDQREDGDGDDQKVKYRLQEGAVVPGHRGAGIPAGLAQGHLHVFEVQATDQEPQNRGDDVGDQRGHDLAEPGSDHHADGHVDDVALHGEGFEVCQNFHVSPGG
jgi:hypothetical protein